MKKTIPLLLAVLLTGCAAGFEDEFTCSTIDGLDGCPTMNDIHAMVDEGAYNTDRNGVVIGNKGKKSDAVTKTIAMTQQQSLQVNAPLTSGEPQRYREVVKEIVIFPYQDSHGNYYDTAIVHTVLKSSHWLSKPPSAVIHSQYE